MKIICSKSDLLKGVNIVMKAVPSKTTMTILECILIDASAGQIKFTANDMELGIETIVDGRRESLLWTPSSFLILFESCRTMM